MAHNSLNELTGGSMPGSSVSLLKIGSPPPDLVRRAFTSPRALTARRQASECRISLHLVDHIGKIFGLLAFFATQFRLFQ